MATSRDFDIGCDEYSDLKCSICAKKNKVANANYYCYDCQKHLCTYCLATHNEFNENHNVVQGLADGKDVITEKCGKHADELITLYCRQDDELLCRKCLLLEHRKCQEPQNIRESSAELNGDPELQTVPAELKSALDNINKAIEALDQHVASIQKNGNSFLKDLEDYAKKLLSRIEELREKGKRDVKSKQEEILAVTKQHRQACALTKDEINKCLDKITKSNEWKANMFVLKKKGQKIPEKVEALFTESKSLIAGHQFHFKTNMKIIDSLNSFHSLIKKVITTEQNISSLGAVVGAEDRSVQAPVGQQGSSRVGGLVEKPSVLKAQSRSKQVRMVTVKFLGDKGCSISGACHLDNGSLVVADSRNRRLNLVDPSSGKFTKYCNTDEQPNDVCCIGPQEVAFQVAYGSTQIYVHSSVSLTLTRKTESTRHVAFGSTQVDVYNVVSLTRTRTINLRYKTSYIACHGGLLYCATGGWDDNILSVHNVSDGRQLREFSLSISDIAGIAVNGSGDRLYVTDREGLICVNMDGWQIFHLYKHELRLSGACGVTTDHAGHVFVCGCFSDKVVKVTEDGDVVGKILSWKDGIKTPSRLSYDVSRSQLCVVGGADQILMVEWK